MISKFPDKNYTKPICIIVQKHALHALIGTFEQRPFEGKDVKIEYGNIESRKR